MAADITRQSNDSGQLEPMIRQAAGVLAVIGHQEQLDTVLADGGYWNNAHITALNKDGMNVIIPTRSAVRTNPGSYPPNNGHTLSGSTGSWTHRKARRSIPAAQHTVEPVLRNTKFNRGIRRFSRRGLIWKGG